MKMNVPVGGRTSGEDWQSLGSCIGTARSFKTPPISMISSNWTYKKKDTAPPLLLGQGSIDRTIQKTT